MVWLFGSEFVLTMSEESGQPGEPGKVEGLYFSAVIHPCGDQAWRGFTYWTSVLAIILPVLPILIFKLVLRLLSNFQKIKHYSSSSLGTWKDK